MCFGGKADRDDQEGTAKNREIEKLIRADEKKAAREVKLLLLGEQVLPFRQSRPLHVGSSYYLITGLH